MLFRPSAPMTHHSLFVSVCLALLTLSPAHAQWTPTKPVELVVGVSPGGGIDRTARTIQRILQERRFVEVPVSVVNKPGGGSRDLEGTGHRCRRRQLASRHRPEGMVRPASRILGKRFRQSRRRGEMETRARAQRRSRPLSGKPRARGLLRQAVRGIPCDPCRSRSGEVAL